jgi:hypothetical protein
MNEPPVKRQRTLPPNANNRVSTNALITELKKKMEVNLDTIRSLHARGANLNEVDSDGKTPLEYAIQRFSQSNDIDSMENNANIIYFLLENGADPTKHGPNSEPLIFQLEPIHQEEYSDFETQQSYVCSIIKNMKQFGANMNARDAAGKTPLIRALEHKNDALVLCFLNNGADINIQTENGITALSTAAEKSVATYVEALLGRYPKITPRMQEWFENQRYAHDVHMLLAPRMKTRVPYVTPQRNDTPLQYEPVQKLAAYTAFGHGFTPKDSYFTIPPNCIVIAKAEANETLYTCTTDKILYALSDLRKPILMDPVEHRHTILNKMKSATIYQPGTRCPNFIYQFAPEFTHGLAQDLQNRIERHRMIEKIRERQSTLAELQKIKESQTHFIKRGLAVMPFYIGSLDNTSALQYEGDLSEVGSTLLVKNVIDYMYQQSVYPRKEDVHEVMKSIVGPIRYEFLTIDSVSEEEQHQIKLHPKLRASQEDLCRMFPGVYYHLVCRNYIEFDKEPITYWEYYRNKQSGKMAKHINPSIISIQTAPEHIQYIAKEQIANSLRRKATVRNLQGGKRSKKRRTRRNKHNKK